MRPEASDSPLGVQLQTIKYLSSNIAVALQQQDGPSFVLQSSGPFCFGVALLQRLKGGDRHYHRDIETGKKKKSEIMLLQKKIIKLLRFQ